MGQKLLCIRETVNVMEMKVIFKEEEVAIWVKYPRMSFLASVPRM